MDDAAKIACCKMCMLSAAMKDCPKCDFKIGLPFRLIAEAEREQEKTLIPHLAEIKASLNLEA